MNGRGDREIVAALPRHGKRPAWAARSLGANALDTGPVGPGANQRTERGPATGDVRENA
jgi:hypothetical protein